MGTTRPVRHGSRVRAVLLVAAAFLMVAGALSMLGVRPLRRLGLRAPASLPGRPAGAGLRWPAVLGFLTVGVPCGVTLSVGLLAMQSTSAIAGAAAMAGFVFGTAPGVLRYTCGIGLHSGRLVVRDTAEASAAGPG